jgi:threonine synthase
MERIRYRDSYAISPDVTRREAILNSQPPSGGLYLPVTIPQFQKGEIKSLRGASLPDIGYACMTKYLAEEIPAEYVRKMCSEALDYPIPVEPVYARIFTEKQGMGPTGAFKDTAARLLAREASYYIQQGQDRESWLLVATSGDTGAAIRGGFHNVPGINVIIVYPRDNVTDTQAALMNRYGDNVIALACEGTFGDLQEMCMTAFADADLKEFHLWSANSIGIGRAQPQIIHAVIPLTDARVMDTGKPPVMVVPSGNFGHLYAFLLARRMGAFDSKLIVANNANNIFDRFLKTGLYEVRDTVRTISNAMDVDDPSNVRRIFDMFGGRLIRDKKYITASGKEKMVCRIDKMPDLEAMRSVLYSTTITEQETRDTIKRIYDTYHFAFEPHGAVAIAAAERVKPVLKDGDTIVTMETAHPAKFPEVLQEFGIPVEAPDYMKQAMAKPSLAINFSNKYQDLKEFLLSGEAEKVIRRQKTAR